MSKYETNSNFQNPNDKNGKTRQPPEMPCQIGASSLGHLNFGNCLPVCSNQSRRLARRMVRFVARPGTNTHHVGRVRKVVSSRHEPRPRQSCALIRPRLTLHLLEPLHLGRKDDGNFGVAPNVKLRRASRRHLSLEASQANPQLHCNRLKCCEFRISCLFRISCFGFRIYGLRNVPKSTQAYLESGK